MIEIENIRVFGAELAIKGMRNPLESWDLSDSYMENPDTQHADFIIGENDLKLAKQLVKAGTDESKFLRMINIQCDIVAPQFWWHELDTYKVGTVRNSTSKMHKIHTKDFTINDFSLDTISEIYEKFPNYRDWLESIMKILNALRKQYNETKDKVYWRALIELLPESYNMRSTWQGNYQVLRNIYHARKNHKLKEWQYFCAWIEILPYSELITMPSNRQVAG